MKKFKSAIPTPSDLINLRKLKKLSSDIIEILAKEESIYREASVNTQIQLLVTMRKSRAAAREFVQSSIGSSPANFTGRAVEKWLAETLRQIDEREATLEMIAAEALNKTNSVELLNNLMRD